MAADWRPIRPVHTCPEMSQSTAGRGSVAWGRHYSHWFVQNQGINLLIILCCPYCGLTLEQPPKEG